MNSGQRILQCVHIIVSGDTVEEIKVAFAALSAESIEAAEHMAAVMGAALPLTAPLWAAILDKARNSNGNAARRSDPPLTEQDAQDTADGIAARMGWRSMEPGK